MKRVLWSLALSLASGASLGAQGEVEIVHDPIECWPVDQFPMLRSSFVPPDDIQSAKFYFRSTEQIDFYYVQLSLGSGGGLAIGPKAEPTTAGVSYYLEIVTRSYSSYRTEERSVPVASGDECQRRDPEAAYYSGQNPDIAVGATRAGASPLPPGFQADGVSRFMNVTGIAGDAGGPSAKTIGIIAGLGGAGAAALAFTGGGGGDPTTTSPLGGTTTIVAGSSTSTAIGGGGSSTTTTAGGGNSTSSTTTTVGGGGSTTTVTGSSTTTIVGGSTTTSSIGVSTSTTSPASTTSSPTTTTSSPTTTTSSPTTTTSSPTTTTSSPTTTTSSPTTTTSSPTTTTSVATTTTSIRPTTTVASGADMVLDSITDSPASVVTGGVVTYTIRVTNRGPATAPNALISFTMGPNDLDIGGTNCTAGGPGFGQCSIGALGPNQSASRSPNVRLNGVGAHTLRATVGGGTTDPDTSNNAQSETTNVTANQRTEDGQPRAVQMLSTLDVRPLDGRIRARITVNDAASEETSNTGPRVHRLRAQAGENRVQMQVDLAPSSSGTWRIDFSSAQAFVAGSLRVQSGMAVSQDAKSITFALNGAEDLRFTFELSE